MRELPVWLLSICVTPIQASFGFPLAKVWAFRAAFNAPVRTLIRGKPWEDVQ